MVPVVIEVVKGTTKKKEIEKIINEFNKNNFKDYYFITRNVEKKDESPSNK